MNIVTNLQQKTTGGGVTIRHARDEDAPAWDAFVFAAPDATFFHRFGWRGIFRDIFRLDTHYLIAERDRTSQASCQSCISRLYFSEIR